MASFCIIIIIFFLHLISIDDLFRPNQELVTKVTAKHHGCTRCVSRAFSTRKSSRVLSLSPLPLCPPSKVSESQGLIGSVRLHQGGLPEVSGLRETLQRQVEDIFIAEPDTLSKRERKRERERERIARAEKKKGWGWEEKDGEGGAHIIQDYFATRRFPILGKHLTLNHRHIDRNALYSKAIREGCYMYSKYKDDTRINFRRWSIIIFYLSVFCFSFFFFSKFFFPIFFVSLFAFLPFFLLLFCNVFVKYFKWFQNTKKKKQ